MGQRQLSRGSRKRVAGSGDSGTRRGGGKKW